MFKMHDQNQLGMEKVYFILQIRVHHPENLGQELETRTVADTSEEFCSLAWSLWLALSVTLQHSGPSE